MSRGGGIAEIQYLECSDVDKMISMGISQSPMLEVNGKIIDFVQANAWINNQMHLGFNLKEIQVWLGHGDISTTMNLYAHLNMDEKREIGNQLSQKYQGFEGDRVAKPVAKTGKKLKNH